MSKDMKKSVTMSKEDGAASALAPSMGWRWPQVKLNEWDPEDEKQWNVSYCNAMVFSMMLMYAYILISFLSILFLRMVVRRLRIETCW